METLGWGGVGFPKAAGCWLLAAGCWLLAGWLAGWLAGCWLAAGWAGWLAGCWLLAGLAAGCWLGRLAAGWAGWDGWMEEILTRSSLEELGGFLWNDKYDALVREPRKIGFP